MVMSEMNQLSTPSIHIEFASASPVAAILRRGSTQWVRLLSWNTADDTVHAGSWFHGRIYEDGCSVSPDGTYFAYFALKYHGRKTRGVNHAWTAVSKLPWLTALALWPQSSTHGGRAKFSDNKTLIIDCPHWESLKTEDKLPDDFIVHPRWIGVDAPEQSLPCVPRSQASFNGFKGIDQLGRDFEYADCKLKRDGRVIVDFKDMYPNPQSSPECACQWEDGNRPN